MELTIYQSGAPCGKARAEFGEKRLRVRARCAFFPGIRRLYLLSDGGVLPLGVMLPEDGALTLERTLRPPEGVTPETLRRGVLCEGDERPGVLPERCPDDGAAPPRDRWMETARPESFTRDEVLRRTMAGAEGALYRYRSGYAELAFPAREARKIAPVLLFARPEQIRGEAYLVLSFSGEGRPIPSDEASTY
jgi:hypothetical protein